MAGIPCAGNRVWPSIGTEEGQRHFFCSAPAFTASEKAGSDFAHRRIKTLRAGIVIKALRPGIGRRVRGRMADNNRHGRGYRIVGIGNRFQNQRRYR